LLPLLFRVLLLLGMLARLQLFRLLLLLLRALLGLALRLLALLFRALLLLRALAGLVGGTGVGAMRRNGGRIGVRRGPGRGFLGRSRLVFPLVLVLIVVRILVLRWRGMRDDRIRETDRKADADDVGQGVLAQCLHGSRSGSRQRPHGRSRRERRLTISENRRRRVRRSAGVKPRGFG
jgi:hypothetical protein